MIGISAQVSLYPLGQSDLAPAIQALVDTLHEYGLPCEVGSMSTVVWGRDQVVFAALQEAYRRTVAYGPAVLQVTLSNACPLPPADGAGAGVPG
ncbi:MAG: YkoF family thiamine/hydroxymethylpyrimidine-binding protein [Anaerolineae bacterium]